MAFATGKSGNPSGRTKGIPNKATAAIKERIEQVLTALDETLADDLKALGPQQRIELWAKLQEFIRPKLRRTALVGDPDEPARGVVLVQLVGAMRSPTTSEKDVLE